MEKERLQVKTSIESTSSDITVTSYGSDTCDHHDELELPPWTSNHKATSYVFNSLTAMYALILTIVAFIIEVSPTWQSKGMSTTYTIFCLLMYIIAILYFIYLYLFVIYPNILNGIFLRLERIGLIKDIKKFILEEALHNGEGAGTLYLRLGALLFGTFGSVLWGTEIFLCAFDENRRALHYLKYILAVVFTYIQMHFIFCNSKITLRRTDYISSFGMMHCIAVNLWIWFSLCLAKAQYKDEKKTKTEYSKNKTYIAIAKTAAEFSFDEKQLRSLYKLGVTANFLLTMLVEFSLISAAVCFIIWKYQGDETMRVTRKKHVRFDCKSTSIGIFFGLVLLIGSFVSICMHQIMQNDTKEWWAEEVIGIAEIVLFCTSLLACILAFFRMRKLQYRLHAHGEVIDEILLIVGLAGELVYCSTGLDVYVNEKRMRNYEPPLVVGVFTIRIVQVILQSLFILIASRLRSASQSNITNQPGKQIVTFLVVCNINLFIYHIFETIDTNFGFPTKVSSLYSNLLNISSPLVVFYRFHSSACLAEMWKHAYSNKHHHSHTRRNEINVIIDKIV